MMTCEEIEEQGLAERYLARALSGEEEEAFEVHFFQCQRCQQEIELGITIRRALRKEPAARLEGVAPFFALSRIRPRLRLAAGVGTLMAAAGLAAVLLTRGGGPDSALVELGQVLQPPIYLGLPVRPEEDRADTLFAQAMDAYVAGDYRGARAGLRSALEAGVEPAAAEFFLGASLLMLDRPDEAAAAFAGVIALGRTPYFQEAHFYRAKALLRLGNAGDALAEFRAATGANAIGLAADSLATRLEELLQR